MQDLRQELRQDMRDLRQEVQHDVSDFRQGLQQDMRALGWDCMSRVIFAKS